MKSMRERKYRKIMNLYMKNFIKLSEIIFLTVIIGFFITACDLSDRYEITLSKTGTYTFPAAIQGYGEQTPLNVIVTNTGNRPTGRLTYKLSDSNHFLLSYTDPAYSNSLAVGSKTNFDVSPRTGTSPGTYKSTVTVSGDNSIWAEFEVSFTVNSGTYGISLSQNGTHTFPAASAGYGAQQPLTVTVTNTGDQATGTLTIALSGADSSNFTLSNSNLSSIVVGSSRTFTVAPRTDRNAGTYNATVAVSGGNGIWASFQVSFTVN
uniref:CARDB domain-containing protein n=1 Tax=uncultured bacterium contig00053 TaxID=1181537 RepID=A0A806KB23_9BACT|nr:hypothetical protein [uncultured bacterium contig00053]